MQKIPVAIATTVTAFYVALVLFSVVDDDLSSKRVRREILAPAILVGVIIWFAVYGMGVLWAWAL